MSTRSTSAVSPGGQLRPHDNNFDDPSNRYSGVGAVGMGFLTGDIDDDDDEDEDLYPKTSHHPPGLTPMGRPGPAVVSPSYDVPPVKPGAAKIPTALRSMVQTKPPAPIQVSFANQTQPRTKMRAPPPAVLHLPQVKAPPTPGPMSPHPLQPPKTPIMPAFARPRNNTDTTDVKFASDAILRGNKEETLLPRNTPKGAEFWRRFSVVVKEDEKHPGKFFKSSWLSDHQTRSFRLNMCVWIVALMLIALIAGGGVLIWFLTSHNTVSNPKALGGNAGEGIVNATSSAPTSTTSSGFAVYSVTGDLPPTSTPPIPAGLTLPTTPPDAAIQKRSFQSHRRHMRRMSD